VGEFLRLLLDTHALLWWFTNDKQLSSHVRNAVGDECNEIFVSAASAWEISTKHRLGKLAEAATTVTRFDELVAADGFEHLPMRHYHALKAGSYAVAHADPFDRMLAAQSELERLTLVTRDPVFSDLFQMPTLW
jgi:PIN domain nuclease of toxin-antitoxin system